MRKQSQTREFQQPQRGLVLLLLVLVILAIFGVVFLTNVGSALSGTQRQIQQAQATNDVLMAAKAALLGYVVQTTDGGSVNRLGNLPMPDILNVGPTPPRGTAIQYDGYSDSDAGGANKCLSTGVNGLPGVSSGTTSRQSTQRCLGKFPWRTLNLDVGNPSVNDPIGQVPWLAISANLNYSDRCLGILNSDTLNWVSTAGTSCPAPPNQIPYPWMTVVDQSGNMLSNRVVAVMIMPGSPIQTGNRTQSRTLANPGYASDYLDVISVPLGCSTTCTATFDNAALTNTFIQIPAGTHYPVNAEDTNLAGSAVKFNDILIYITIDELMYYIERRVVSEMANAMQTFKLRPVSTGLKTYPWLQPLSAIFVDSISLYTQQNTTFGAFPFMTDYLVGSTHPFFRTDFAWTLSGASESTVWQAVNGTGMNPSNCYHLGSSPDRYMRNPLIGTLNASNVFGGPFANASAPVSEGTCKWLGASQIQCEQNVSAIDLPVSLYPTLSSCNSGSGALIDTLSISKKILLLTECQSPASMSVAYSNASTTSPHRWSWTCNSSGAPEIVDVQYKISNSGTSAHNLLPRVAKLTSGGSNQNFVLKDMRYHPVMPSWFYDNGWYLTAFAALAPVAGVAPATPTINPCGSVTSLTLGGTSGVSALVMLSGKTFPTQSRPSSAVIDYFDDVNISGASTCNFINYASPAPSVLNDSLLALQP